MKRLFLCAALALCPLIGAMGQDIRTDPFVKKTIDRSNFEPGRKYDLFQGDERGKLDTSSRSGQVSVVRTSVVRLGSYSLQGATINGTYVYILRFGNHPSSVHGPFSEKAYRTAKVRENRGDGSQTSVDFDWTAIKVHPADAYDGAQGDGYPPPTGARDEYYYTLHGTATGVYVVSATDMQMLDTSTIVQRLISSYKSATASGNGRVSAVSAAARAGLAEALDDAKRYLQLQKDNAKVGKFKSKNEEWQYATLQNWSTPTATGGTNVTKNSVNSNNNKNTNIAEKRQELQNAQNAAMANPDYQPDTPSDGVTHCNQAANSIAKAVGINTEGILSDSKGNAYPANTQIKNLSDPDNGYHEVTPEQAQDLADSGTVVFATQYGDEHGHIATVRPSDIDGDAPRGSSGPILANVGIFNSSARQSAVFSSAHGKVVYYAPKE